MLMGILGSKLVDWINNFLYTAHSIGSLLQWLIYFAYDTPVSLNLVKDKILKIRYMYMM